jgi:CRISPR-associated protein Csm2
MSNIEYSVYIDICKPLISIKKIIEIIDSRSCFKELIEDQRLPCYAASIAVTMKKVTSTQMRRFYGYVKNIEQINRHLKNDRQDFEYKHKLMLLLPKIAGSSERENLIELYEVIKSSIVKIKDVGDVRAFVDFFEAILDFHSTLENKKEDQ